MKLGGAAAAACAACCAVSIAPAVMAATTLAAIGGAAFAWGLGIAALALPVAGLYFLSRRKAVPGAKFQSLMAADDECGCGSPRGATTHEEPIACTLGASDFEGRAASIRDLARRSLRHASRTPLSLSLSYAPDAIEELRELVRKEQSCCAFLAFDLREEPAGVLLTITAPHSAADAADALFDHFAPELAAPKLTAVAVTTRI
jgi:hypothetical protein